MLAKHLAMALIGTALVSAPALAQSNQSTNPATPQSNSTMGAPATTSSSGSSASSSSMNSANFMTQEQPGQWRASKLEGLDVYNNNNEKIGDIREMLVDGSGKIQAVVIGVGGFLGMGEHDVAVPFEQIKFMNEPRRASTAANTNPPAAGSTASTTNMASNNASTANTNAANTTGSVATGGGDNARRSTPDHALLDMTKDQLKAAPEFKYNR